MRAEVGVCLAAFADQPLPAALEEVRRADMTLVDLPTDSVYCVSPSMEGIEERRAAVELVNRSGVRVVCVSNSRDCQLVLGPHGPHTDGIVAGDARAKREYGQRCAHRTIELAERLGAPLARLFLGCPDFARWLQWTGSEVSWSDNVDAFVEVVAPLATTATDAGVTLCIEPHVKQVPFDAATLQACLDGVAALGGTLAVCFDPANLAAIGRDPVEFLHAIGPVPSCVHVKDVEHAPLRGSTHGPGWVTYGPQPPVRFRAMPWGQLDWRAIVSALQEVGYEGPLLVEHEDVLVAPGPGVRSAADEVRRLLLEPGRSERWW
jgi:sugar phosphate isomerase/epimerase